MGVIHLFSTLYTQISLTYPHGSSCDKQNENVILSTYQKDTNSFGFSKCHAFFNASDFQDGSSKNQNNFKTKERRLCMAKGNVAVRQFMRNKSRFADLYGMFSEHTLSKEILDNLVANYKINLVTVEDIDDINHFRTDLQYIFGMLKCRKSKEKLVSFTNENSEYFHCVDGESYLAISELLHSEKLLKNSVKREEMEDGVDMCKALEDLYQEGRTELLLETLKDLGPVSEELQQKIVNEKNLDILKKWNKLAARAESIEEFLKEMKG